MADEVAVSIAIERSEGAAAAEVAERVLRALPEWFGLDNRCLVTVKPLL